MIGRVFAGVVCLFFVTECQAVESVAWETLSFRSAQGDPIRLRDENLKVVCFLGTECPLAKLYGARLQQMANTFGKQGVSFIGVNSNSQDSPLEITNYATKHGIQFPIAKDADQSIAIAFDAKRTPEVFVVDPLGAIRYQGRIDDQYEPGVARTEPTTRDLHDALANLVTGKMPTQAKTEPVGCLITRIAKKSLSQAEATTTFTRDIVPILNEHCVECHRAGEIGPFELTDYDEVVGWGQMMLEVIDQGRMPPWHADPAYGHFIGERRLPQQARDAIANWIDEGMPQGDVADLPVMPQWNTGWHLPRNPDIEIAMRDRPFAVPSEGVVDYQYFVVDPGWTTDQWVAAAQVIPGDAAVVHHAIVFVRPPDGTNAPGIGWLGAYVPGQRSMLMPPGHARRIPAGSKLVFQMHYTPNGHETSDTSRVGVWLANPKEITHEVSTALAVNHDFEIPPGVENHVVQMKLDSFPQTSRLLGATPHMHVRGKSFTMVANEKSGEQVTLLSVPHYDFNWQHWYAFAEPIELDAITSLDMTVSFDNSSRNPANPAPSDFVTWGDQTFEEMAIAFFDVATPLNSSHSKKVSKSPAPMPVEIAARDELIQKRIAAFLTEMDTNDDGVIERDEAPTAFRRFGFSSMDRNGDTVIDRTEIERSAAERP